MKNKNNKSGNNFDLFKFIEEFNENPSLYASLNELKHKNNPYRHSINNIQLSDQKIDLHSHSTDSDGVNSSNVINQFAIENNFLYIAKTDHNCDTSTIDYIQKNNLPADACFIKLSENCYRLTGIEFTCQHKGSRIHLLVYCPDYSNEKFMSMLALKMKSDRNFIYHYFKLLRKRMNIEFSIPELKAYFNFLKRSQPKLSYITKEQVKQFCLNKPDILLSYGGKQKFIEDFDNIFAGLPEPAYIRLQALDVLKTANETGAICILAHPHYSFKDQKTYNECSEALYKNGLAGEELVYGNKRAINGLNQLPLRGLITGGTDSHNIDSKKLGLVDGIQLHPHLFYDFISAVQKLDKKRQEERERTGIIKKVAVYNSDEIKAIYNEYDKYIYEKNYKSNINTEAIINDNKKSIEFYFNKQKKQQKIDNINRKIENEMEK